MIFFRFIGKKKLLRSWLSVVDAHTNIHKLMRIKLKKLLHETFHWKSRRLLKMHSSSCIIFNESFNSTQIFTNVKNLLKSRWVLVKWGELNCKEKHKHLIRNYLQQKLKKSVKKLLWLNQVRFNSKKNFFGIFF